MSQIKLNEAQQAMLNGQQGTARQMGMRLLLDLAATAGATELVPIRSAHLSGVSPLTGGLGLRQFLARLAEDPQAKVAVPTTLNAAGCDEAQFEAMRIVAPNFKEHNSEIVARYAQLGVRPTQSCIPYEWEGVVTTGEAAWAESNAICFGNSYTGLVTNRESGLSALAAALTGYTPKYGLMLAENRRPNLEVLVSTLLADPTDFSVLGDWIGKQRRPSWQIPYGPIPLIKGLPTELTHEQKKALTAAAANYGCPLLYLDGHGEIPPENFQAKLAFGEAELQKRYEELAPETAVSLITIGCPQASLGELRATAELLQGKQLHPDAPPLWVFTSAANKDIAQKTGLAEIITHSGALLLENTCPEVVPYDQSWVHQVLTNSLKAEHYIKSGLNGIPTAVMRLADCVALATGELEIGDWRLETEVRKTETISKKQTVTPSTSDARIAHPVTETFTATGHGLPSQSDFSVTAVAFVTDTPITLLGFVNRESGVIEEPGHPADGQSMAGRIAIFPKGSGSTVAPYVLLELFYRGNAPVAVVNTEIDQQSAPACSLENIPYAYQFDANIIAGIQNGDTVQLKREGERVTIDVTKRLAV
ncbi:aconitase X [Candidatus Leptofilum sp.]|uniref:aconitase X n=1 Tax=Candidatus Leptofilum sp. TaxID=3241576 RepID=UPI003B59D8C1